MFRNRSLSLILFCFAIWVVFINLDPTRQTPSYDSTDDSIPMKLYVFADNKKIIDKATPRQMLTFKVRSSEDLYVGFFSQDGTGKPFLNADIMEVKPGETKHFMINGRERGILMPQQKTKFGVYYAESEEEIKSLPDFENWDEFALQVEVSLK